MNIGIYLGYPFKVDLDGAGVGRYIFRLVEGLLRARTETDVHILAMPVNITQIAKVFMRLKTDFPDRVVVYCSDDLNWINAKLPVDLWIIPAVVIDSAQYLTKPVVVCLHDVAYIHFRELEALGKRVDGLVKVLTNKAVAVICNSDYIRTCDALNYLRLPREKTHVIRPAAPIEEYSNTVLRSEADFREHYHLDKSYFVFPSSITWRHKNHIRLIDAFFRFKQTQATRQLGPYLVFTERGDDFCQKNEFLQTVGQYDPNLLSDIIFLGRLPSQDIPALYKYAAGTIVPTLFEGSCPFPILESLIMGTPVAFGRIAVAIEVISDLRDLITFDSYDVADMQRALGELWESGPDAAEKQKAALGGFIERTWQDVAKEYYAVIDRTMGYETPMNYPENEVAAVTGENETVSSWRNIAQGQLQVFKTIMQNLRENGRNRGG